MLKDLERIKWYLWHGNVFQALNELASLEMDLESAAFESKDENSQKVSKGVEDLHTYVERNREFVPNYGERYRNGEKIASGFVESAINQVVSKRMVKKQQIGWSQRGAHLLQIRTRVLDEEWENTFRRWYPDCRRQGQAKKVACPPESPALQKALPTAGRRGCGCVILQYEDSIQDRSRRRSGGHFEATDRGRFHYLEKRLQGLHGYHLRFA